MYRCFPCTSPPLSGLGRASRPHGASGDDDDDDEKDAWGHTGESRRRHGGRSRGAVVGSGGDGEDDHDGVGDDDEDEDIEGLDADTLLERAAMQVGELGR